MLRQFQRVPLPITGTGWNVPYPVTVKLKMGKRPWLLLRIAVFALVFVLTIKPSWWLVEKLWTTDVSSELQVQIHLFAVLVRQPDRGNRYAVDFYPGIEPKSKLVTNFADHDLNAINQDLRASIRAENSKYVYFKVLERGQGYVDVSLEAPMKGDFWRKDSYRIQSDEIHPRRIIFFGPGFGMVVGFLSFVVGMLAAWGTGLAVALTPQGPSRLSP
jgi:hypothetical protein